MSAGPGPRKPGSNAPAPSDPAGPGDPIPPRLLSLLAVIVPRGRRKEVLADLGDAYQGRARRLGEKTANRYLFREMGSLILWRLKWWRGATATWTAAGATSEKTKTLGHDFLQDLRFGTRTLIRRPGFTLIAVLVLGLGIGAPATVLTLVNTIFFERPAGIAEPDRVIRLTRSFGRSQGGGALGNPDYLYYRETNSTLSGLSAFGGSRIVAFSADGEQTDQLRVLFVSDNFFDVLKAEPQSGRGFLPEENATPGTHPVVVLGHSFWVRAMGADPKILGRDLLLAGDPYTVVGVAPEGFGAVSPAGEAPDAWVPIAMYGSLTRSDATSWWERRPDMRDRWLIGLGRMAPGVTFEAARANLVALGVALEYDGKDEGEGAYVQRQFMYSPGLEATLTSLSRMLLAVVGIVLLVAGFNVAVLLLSRATSRYREMGIRTALGAGRARITRQILVETLLLCAGGSLLGLLLAYLFSDLAASLLPVPFASEFRPGWPVILGAAGLAGLTTLGVGLLPALHATRIDVRGAIHGRRDGVSRSRARNGLVVGQVGLSLVLVAGAILFGRSFWTARTQELGFATEHRLVVQVNLADNDYGTEASPLFVRQALERILEVPGVEGATATRQIPFQGDWTSNFDAPPGAVPNAPDNQIETGVNAVSRDYFRVAGIPIRRGRPLGPDDVQGNANAVVINEALADVIWPGLDPLGRTLSPREGLTLEVVGVARNANYYELGEEPYPQLYLSFAQFPQRHVNFLVHTSGRAGEMAPGVEAALRELDPKLAFARVTTMASVFEDETSRYRVSAVLVAVFSSVALLLAVAGLYGTVSFLVARRTREIGVRMALGANRERVAREVLRFGLKLVGFGILLGLAGAVVLRRFTESLLYRIEPDDPLPLVGACLILLAVAALATVAPARHATRVDPMEAIRTE